MLHRMIITFHKLFCRYFLHIQKGFILSTDIDYYINSGRTDGYNQSVPLWNASYEQAII
jgi:hypothetical protein